MESFMQLEAAWMVFMGLCAAVIAVGGAAAVIAKLVQWMRKPSNDNAATLEDIMTYLASDKHRIEDLERSQDEIKRQQEETKHQNKMMLRALESLLDHEIDGNNHTAKLMASKDEIHGYLYDKIED